MAIGRCIPPSNVVILKPPTDLCVLPSNTVIVKSPTDRRTYRYIKLPNGLCTLLVHDPEIYSGDPYRNPMEKKAAAAMCVGMGSFDDPPEVQGLAHFLEHMLFMGSTAFPDENEYLSYLHKHGGSSNAYTEMEYTCYHFEVKQEFLKGALARFAQFFISPLVKAEAMEREVSAVDSEFNKVLQNNLCRLQQLQCHTSAPGHPFNRFCWGNKKSFADAAEKGINLRDNILKLYHEKYNAGSMKLVVIGGETLQVLESWVLELFSGVRKGLSVKPEIKLDFPRWKTGKLYWLEAVEDVHILELSWTLPSLRKDYLKKVDDYLAYLLGHKGRGSLYFLLKAKGWATYVYAGVRDDGICCSSIAYIFRMSIYLTNSGLEKIFEILGFVYQYLNLLHRDPPQGWIFKELQDIRYMEFRFREDQPQVDYAVKLAGNLLVYPPEHVIYGEYAYEVWDKKMIKHLLSFFRPGNMRVDILTKFFKKSQDIQHEPWFGSNYVEEDIPFHLMDLWENPSEIDSTLHLPSKNDFIPRDFSIHSDWVDDASYPRCILDESYMSLWYKLDRTFKLPHSNTFFSITLNGTYNNIRNALLTKLFVFLLNDELNEIIFQASIVNSVASVSINGDKLELRFYSFSDNLSLILAKIMAIAKTFLPKEDRFKVAKEDMERNLRNTNMNPLSHSSYLRQQALCQSLWDVEEELSVLNVLSLADLSAFIPDLFEQMYIEGICHGNLLEYEALQISDIIKSILPVQPLPLLREHNESVMFLPPSADIERDVRAKNKLETNSMEEIYFQIEADEGTNHIKLNVLGEIVKGPFFNQLRTKEQLGYVVNCSSKVTYRILGFQFCVQSSEYNPDYLQGRIDNFINGLEETLVVKEDMERTLRNTNMNPLSHSSYLRQQAICQSFWDVQEELPVLNGMSLTDLSAFTPNLIEQEHNEHVMCLPPSADIECDVRAKNKLETNSVVEIYFQIEPNEGTNFIKLNVLTDLFGEIVKETFFNQLRTKEQLGYVVYCSSTVTYRILGFQFCVQSSEYNPDYLQGRIDNFINGLEEMLDGLDHDSFENYRNGWMGKLLEKDLSLSHETNRLWDQIVEGRYTFDFPEKEVEELKGIEKGDVIDWYHRYLRKPSPDCRRVTTRVWGCNTEWKDDI